MTSVRVKRIKPDPKTKHLEGMAQFNKEQQLLEAERIQTDYEKTVKTWKRDVDFDIDETRFGANVGTDDEVYGYVDKGTKPHVIRPKKAKVLAFRTGGRPKTRPRTITSYEGKPGSPPTLFRPEVQHPGTEARDFTKTIQKRSEKRFAREYRKALRIKLRATKA